LESEEETLQRQEEGNEAATPYSITVQAKLTIGEPGDKYEQEADRVASQVVKQINSPEAAQSTQGQSVQRQEEPVEELQRKPSISDLQRSPLPLEVQREAMPAEEELQAKSILQRREAIAGGEATNDLDTAINSARGSGQPLDAGLQRSMGQAMGADFSGVKVHTDAQSDQLNQSIQAKAFTTGQDVFFRQGAYDPGSRGGQELIAHELTHVVQQNGGAVQRSPLPQVKREKTLQKKLNASEQSKNHVNLRKKEGIIQRLTKAEGVRQWKDRPWSKYITKAEFEKHLVDAGYGNKDNPFERIRDAKHYKEILDARVQSLNGEKITNMMGQIALPDTTYREKGMEAVKTSELLTEQMKKKSSEEEVEWKKRAPQWVEVNGGQKGNGSAYYRFCDYNEISRMLPRIAWETYQDTVESVKAKKRRENAPEPNALDTWNVIQYIELKNEGEKCLSLLNSSPCPQKEKEVLKRAFDHMAQVKTRLSPFVSMSEDLGLLVNSTCPTMQSIIRSDGHLENVEKSEDIEGHKFQGENGKIQRAKGYEKAPHIVKFEIPDRMVVTPELVETLHMKLTQKELEQGAGLRAMKEVKERLFLGTEIWRYAVAVAVNPY
jgi:hypothetical protein